MNKSPQEMKTRGRGKKSSRRGQRGHYSASGYKDPLASTGKGAIKDQIGESRNVGFSIRNLPLFAERTRRTISYYSAAATITGTSTANAYIYSANGCFDPDITGTGGQPMGFDQMMLFYNHYTVLRSRIRVVITNQSIALPLSVALVKSGTTTVLSSVEQLMENGDLAFYLLGYYGQAGSSVRLTQSCNAADYQGLDNVMDDPNMRGDAASNPTEQMYYHIATWNAISATQVSSAFQVVLEYDVIFHEPRKGPLS